MKKLTKLFYLLVGLSVMACSNQNEKSSTFDGTTMRLADSSFVGNVDGKNINLITLKNNKGTIAQFTNFGGRLVSFILPDKNQKPVDIIVGPGSLKDFLSCKEKYFGGTFEGFLCVLFFFFKIFKNKILFLIFFFFFFVKKYNVIF